MPSEMLVDQLVGVVENRLSGNLRLLSEGLDNAAAAIVE
jgi:hypothetical protein